MDSKLFRVTGAASGIGQATAIRLAELGAAGIAISDVNEEGLKKTEDIFLGVRCGKSNARITSRKIDISDADAVERWTANTVTEFGKLDGAANVAGIAGGDGDTTAATIVLPFHRLLSINLSGVMYCMRARLSHMTQPGGSIVNVSSVSGIRGLAKSAPYSASKYGVIRLTKSAAAEFGSVEVRINAVLPGPIDTKIFRDGEKKGLFNADIMGGATVLGRMGTAEEVAKVMCFLLSDDASYVTGGEF
ncbi:putative short chain dehydrogenase/ reductase [Lepidopterella palustris CBS 459.81]|uniref:Putative short chain dehydrogenase/ reductase n=1 Tax=Lepidopterella palustris CBS 459.81 TaxID=1314670 RepID=A0A8E2DZQ5_9PEZI|nr:putative short chain dehydrogenase/ reductase [Lepidopterella palustris CBS 459.81]